MDLAAGASTICLAAHFADAGVAVGAQVICEQLGLILALQKCRWKILGTRILIYKF